MTTSDPNRETEPDFAAPAGTRRGRPRVSRRQLIVGGSIAGVGALATLGSWNRNTSPTSEPASPSAPASADTSVPATTPRPVETTPVPMPPGVLWSSVYGPSSGDVVIDSEVVLDIDARVGSLTVTESGRLVVAPGTSITLTSRGNVEVAGMLVMRPAAADHTHRLHFADVDETAFRGGGMEVAPTDVGLWVVGRGVFDAVGNPKTSWSRATHGLRAGSDRVEISDVSGWRIGDLVTIAPTGPPTPDDGRFHQSNVGSHEYDEASITAIDGNQVTLDRPLEHDHPTISFTTWDGVDRTYGAEVLNLTRNVVISGTESGRAHVLFLRCARPQEISSVQFDRLGPRQATGKNDRHAGVVGRYPFHMHHCGDGSRGSVLRDCLVTRSGNRAFVPHESHGVELDRCVAHDVHGTAYWWDQPGRHNPTGEDPKTHDSLWRRCVASNVWAAQRSENGYRLAGFNLSGGNHHSNRLIDSVAVGVTSDRVTMNNGANSGFHWTEHGQAVWEFTGNLAHNIAGDGILTWQNDEEVHVVTDFTAYHCGAHGIEHGAYSNFYEYSGLTLIGNRMSGIGCHAVTRRTNSVRRRWTDQGEMAPTLTFRDVVIDGRGITKDGVQGLSHKFASNDDAPTLLEDVSISGTTRAGLYEMQGKNASIYRLRNWSVEGADPVMFDPGAPSGTIVETVNLNGDGTTSRVVP